MKIFISYRRDDTGGRAGRLFDQLAARFGTRNVFQDVTAVTPGHDFTEQVVHAIAGSDVTLVVIGPNWLDSRAADGSRRIDHDDDFVRREIAAALTSEVAVVPVLVDDAVLPVAADLPPELAGLVRRQAFELRDVSWRQDVDDLIRRLEGEEPPGSEQRRWWPLVAAGVAVVAIAAVVIALVAGGDDGGNDDDDDDAAELTGEAPFGPIDDDGNVPECPDPDGWTSLPVSDAEPTVGSIEGYEFAARAVQADALERPGEPWLVIVRIDLANTGEPVDGTIDDDIYYGLGLVDGLLVDGVSQGHALCMKIVNGDPQIEPGERAIAAMGFTSAVDPRDTPIVFETDDYDVPITG